MGLAGQQPGSREACYCVYSVQFCLMCPFYFAPCPIPLHISPVSGTSPGTICFTPPYSTFYKTDLGLREDLRPRAGGLEAGQAGLRTQAHSLYLCSLSLPSLYIPYLYYTNGGGGGGDRDSCGWRGRPLPARAAAPHHFESLSSTRLHAHGSSILACPLPHFSQPPPQ